MVVRAAKEYGGGKLESGRDTGLGMWVQEGELSQSSFSWTMKLMAILVAWRDFYNHVSENNILSTLGKPQRSVRQLIMRSTGPIDLAKSIYGKTILREICGCAVGSE